MSENLLSPSGEWRLWPQFALRGPGFPATGVLRLAPDGLAEAADGFAAEAAMTGPAWDDFVAGFDAEAVKTALTMQEIAAQPAFRTAIAWQNPAVLRDGIGRFLDWEPAAHRTSRHRDREALVAQYWQRFCVKNDTIGFFGPVGWGRLDPTADGLLVDPGEGLIASAEVFFTSWAVDALAKTLGEDPAVRRCVPPRRVPLLRVADGAVSLPGHPPKSATPFEVALLRLCDGARDLAALCGQLAAAEDDVVAAIESMQTRRWLVWRLELPLDAHPERHLRTALLKVSDTEGRDRSLAALNTLEHDRDRVAAAGLDADELDAALGALSTDFAELTAVATQHAKGARTAPGRALVYADCRRSATATVGAAVLAELAPLDLCLTAARWLTGQFATAIAGHIRAAYDALAADGPVDLASLWLRCLPAPHGQAGAEIDRIQAQLWERWATVLDLPTGARSVELSAAELAPAVRAAFGERGGEWSLSRYVSPDLLIVAADQNAVTRGDFQLVLGELHIAMNTLAYQALVRQHPNPDELLAQNALDYPRPRLLPMLPKSRPPRISARGKHALVRPEDYHVALVEHTGDPTLAGSVFSADITVTERGGELVAGLPDGAEFPVLDAFCSALSNRAIDRFGLLPPADHTPRITIDKLVVAREAWRLAATSLTFADDPSEARRFALARRWRDALGLPRFVFVWSRAEPRPFYVDFDSPVYVNILAKAARRLARKDPDGTLTVAEMLPTPEQTWLTDDAGNSYTAELRMVAVDQSAAH